MMVPVILPLTIKLMGLKTNNFSLNSVQLYVNSWVSSKRLLKIPDYPYP